MTNEVKLRQLLELRKQEAEKYLTENGKGCPFRRYFQGYWEGRLHQCDEILAFLGGKIEVKVTTEVRVTRLDNQPE